MIMVTQKRVKALLFTPGMAALAIGFALLAPPSELTSAAEKPRVSDESSAHSLRQVFSEKLMLLEIYNIANVPDLPGRTRIAATLEGSGYRGPLLELLKGGDDVEPGTVSQLFEQA